MHKHAAAHAKSDKGGSGSKGEAIAAAIVLAVDVGVVLAERAQAHDGCMVAMGWAPGEPGAAPVRLASNMEATDAQGDAVPADAPVLVRIEDGPIIGDEPRQHVTFWQVVPDMPAR